MSDSGVGLTANKINFTGAEIESKLLTLIHDVNGTYAYHAQRLSNAMKLAGGLTTVADVMEDVAQVTKRTHHSWTCHDHVIGFCHLMQRHDHAHDMYV